MAIFQQPFSSLYSTPDDQHWLKEVTAQESPFSSYTQVCAGHQASYRLGHAVCVHRSALKPRLSSVAVLECHFTVEMTVPNS